jgi:molybdopterin-binding protein
MQMAAVFQRPFLFKGTVGHNVSYGLRLRGVDARRARQAVADALTRVGLEGWQERSALTLSGGEAQRVALARALVLEPRVLLLDEPLASLDAALKRSLTKEFAGILRHEGVTTLYVTHDQDEAVVVAETVAVMNEGRIRTSGPTDEVMGVPPDPWTATFLGLEPSLSGTVLRSAEGLTEVDCQGAAIAAIGSYEPGAQVILGIRPEDVLLMEADAELPRTSARNHLDGTVVELTPRGATYHAVIDLGGPRVASSVSRAAVADLGLEPGTRVIAVFKASAVRVREAPEG